MLLAFCTLTFVLAFVITLLTYTEPKKVILDFFFNLAAISILALLVFTVLFLLQNTF